LGGGGGLRQSELIVGFRLSQSKKRSSRKIFGGRVELTFGTKGMLKVLGSLKRNTSARCGRGRGRKMGKKKMFHKGAFGTGT